VISSSGFNIPTFTESYVIVREHGLSFALGVRLQERGWYCLHFINFIVYVRRHSSKLEPGELIIIL